MEYNKIVAVTGLTGLYEVLSSKNDGAVLRSLDDKTTKFVSNRIHNFSHLETIEVFTTGENVNLVDVFKAMQDSKLALPEVKDNAAVKKYFEKVFPTMDFERVYPSDMKKMIKWYDTLQKNNIELKLTEAPVEETPAAADLEEAETVTTEEAPKKKAASRKKKQEE